MHKDPNLRKRNALVIPGGLLAVWSLIGILYSTYLRGDGGACDDGTQIFLAGACRSVVLVLAIPLIIGLALLAVGVLKFRNRATCRLGHGSMAHFTLAFLLSLFLLPLVGGLLAADATLTRGDVEYPVSTILYGLSAVGLFMLVPFGLLLLSDKQANPCCQEKGCFEPCFCDEPIDQAPGEPALTPMEEADLASSPQPDQWAAVEEPATTPVPAPEPAPAWETVPEEPEPAAMPPAPARPVAPALTTRPTDPAAPPADPMAVVAKWSEEDEEALHDLEGSDPPAGRATRLARKPAKKQAKAAKTPAKKPAKKR